jgi:hypothetical protein
LAAASSAGSKQPAKDEAKELLRDLLVEGPVTVAQIKAQARDAGISRSTIRCAKD